MHGPSLPFVRGRNNRSVERQLLARALHLSGLCRGYVCPAPRVQPLPLAPIEILNPNPPTYRLSKTPGDIVFQRIKACLEPLQLKDSLRSRNAMREDFCVAFTPEQTVFEA